MTRQVFEYGRLTTNTQAEEFREVQYRDYVRIGVPDSDARQMAFGDNSETPRKMLNALENGDRRYFGLRDGDSLAAVASLSDWLHGDAAHYRGRVINKLAEGTHKVNVALGRVASRDSYIPAFGITDNALYEEEAKLLLDKLAAEAELKQSRYLYTAADLGDDEYISVFTARGAKKLPGKVEMIDVNGVNRLHALMRLKL